jgi:predicted nucleic acid-binding protein
VATSSFGQIVTLDDDMTDCIIESNETANDRPFGQGSALAKEFMSRGVKPKDASHLACAVKAGCDYFFTTDDRLLKFKNEEIAIMNPMGFIQSGEDGSHE